MVSGEPRPNFYLILGLDPRAPWDQRAYSSSLDERRRQWSAQRSGIKTHPSTVEARRNLGLVREIERVMSEPWAREKERVEAIAAIDEENRHRAARVAQRVDRMLAKGFLFDVEYEALKNGDLPIADILVQRRVEGAEKRPAGQVRTNIERLDPSKERNLREYLAIVRQPDLYAVLRSADPSIGSHSTRAELYASADKLYQVARNTADKDRPEVGALQNLAGIAREIFGSDELMRRYKLSMRLAPLDPIMEQYEQDLAPVRAIDARQFEMFLRDAAKLGVDVAMAKETFVGYFRDRNWSVEVPGAAAEAVLKTLVSCPRCAELNEPQIKHCAKCGSSLTASCPRCDSPVSVAATACQRCGFRVGDRDYAEYLAEEVEACMERVDALGAADFLRRASQAWPLGSDNADPLAVRLTQLQERLELARERQQQTIGQISALMENCNYRAALRQIHGLSFSTPATVRMLQSCEEAVHESERKLTEARLPGTSDERKAELYIEALDNCGDNSEARRELARLPPRPPRHLRTHIDAERRIIRLQWEPAKDAGCSSVVIRVDGPAPPTSAHGYHRHITQTAGTWEDHDPLVGSPMWYAVYTERDISGTLSARGEVAAEPVLLTTEPQFIAVPGDHQVELTWSKPENAVRVEIQREEISTGIVVRFPPPENDASYRVDGNVRNESRYRYTARAVYTYQIPGRLPTVRHSREVTREVIPAAPPIAPLLQVRGYPPPSHIDLYRQRVTLEWTQIEQGEVRTVRSLPGHPVPGPGAVFPEDDLGQYEVVSGHEYIWVRREQVCYFTPVLVLNHRCYAGKTRPYAIGPEVGDLRAEQAGTSAIVTWAWPDEVDGALVAWDYENEVADSVVAQLQTMVRRANGAGTGQYEIPVGSGHPVFVRVASVVRDAGDDFFTSGVGRTVQPRTINLAYEVRPGRGQKVRLILHLDRPAYLPALVLVGRADDRPAGPGDKQIQRIPPGDADSGTVVEVQLDKAIMPTSCRLFAAEGPGGPGGQIVNIVHPQLHKPDQAFLNT